MNHIVYKRAHMANKTEVPTYVYFPSSWMFKKWVVADLAI